MAIILMLPLLLCLLLLVWLKYRFSYWELRKIPHTRPSLIFGNLDFTHWSRKYREAYFKFKGTGPFAGFYHYHAKTAVVLEPELAKNILITDFSNFDERGLYHNKRDDPLTGNIFFLDGTSWRRLRQKVTPAFTSNKMKLMSTIMETICEKFVDLLEQKTKAGAIDLNVFDVFGRFTADVIGSCAFGLQCQSFETPNADFVNMGRKFFNEPRHNVLIEGIITSFPNISRSLGMRVIAQDVNDFYINIVRNTVRHRESSNEKRDDLMNSLIEFSKNKELNDDGLTVNEIAAQAFVFFIAGFETSSTTLTFTTYELAQNQDIQDRLRAHINEVLARHDNKLNYESIHEMNYLDMVVNETLRKHAPVPQLIRKTQRRYETSDPKYFIEPGTLIIVPVQAIHHDPEFYPNPEEFKPERFLPEEIQKRPAGTYLPFGEGPRNCVGYRFAKMQIKFCLANIIRKFRFEVSSKTEIPYKIIERNALVAPQNGIILRCEKIK